MTFRLANVGAASTANTPMRCLPLNDYALRLVRLLTKLICLCPSAILFLALLWQLRAAPLFPCVVLSSLALMWQSLMVVEMVPRRPGLCPKSSMTLCSRCDREFCVWDSVPEDEDAAVCHLQAHTQPWKSAQDDPKLARSLLMQDVEAGFAYILTGGFAEAKQRWGGNLAAGKLGIVQVVGKKPRLIGDGSISGANGRCTIQERPRLPGLHGVQRFLSRCERGSAWVALSFDVACAHKRVRVRDSEQGFGCFALEDELFVYRCCYFGAKYSAYWWARVGGWVTRMLHRFVWVSHALFLYVDDGMLLLPKPVAPLLASACLAFLSALGVPLSWRKVHLGSEIVWIGWRFCFKTATAALPSDKVVKILDLLQPLCVAKAKVHRKHVEQVIGILIWYTTGASWLRPWLSAFYKLLYKPRAIPKKLSVQQFEQLRGVLGHDLSVRKPLPALDVDDNWKLHSVCGSVVSSLNSQVLQAPRVHQGSVSVVFF